LPITRADLPLLRDAVAGEAQGERRRVLGFAGLLRAARSASPWSLGIPAFGGAAFDGLLARVHCGASRLGAEAVAPALEKAVSAWPALAGRDPEACRHTVVRMVLEATATEALGRGLLPAWPEVAPPSWGTWLWWEGPEGPHLIEGGLAS
jgi:hypothetical protein